MSCPLNNCSTICKANSISLSSRRFIINAKRSICFCGCFRLINTIGDDSSACTIFRYVSRLIARLPFSTLFIVSSDMSALSASSAYVIPSLLRSFLIFPAIISYICSLFPIIPSSFLTLPHYIRNYYGVWQSVTICHFRVILCRFLSIPF